ncbi:hypothetical protein BGZ76_008885 [Entomortierella beljakovae]|nr:hypothetical protein BGZ76_008885 [Entomortierella beljakovae]
MFRALVRLGGASSQRIWTQQASRTQVIGASRLSIASFHAGTFPTAVNVSSNVATTPSTPLPPPMATSLDKESLKVSDSEAQTTTAEAAAAAVAKDLSSSSEETESEAEAEDFEDGDMKGFAEFTPVPPEQARSLEANPILKQLVNTVMKDGKKARAQRFVADALLEIRSRTQSDPYQVVLDGLELASPILKLTALKKGSKVLQVPCPMTERQRRRKAIVWILEASDKRKGEKMFKDRLASEFLAVVNGNSGALLKKNQQHKMALANRANASLKSSSGAIPPSPNGLLNIHRSIHHNVETTNDNTRAVTPTDRAPVQFNTFEIERSFQQLLKKQPVANMGPSVLHGRASRDPSQSKTSKSRLQHQLLPSAQSPFNPNVPRRTASTGSNTSSSNGRGSSFSPTPEHGRNSTRTGVGKELLGDTEGTRMSEDHEEYEETQKQQWQIDYEKDNTLGDQIEHDDPESAAEMHKQTDSHSKRPSSYNSVPSSSYCSNGSNVDLQKPTSRSQTPEPSALINRPAVRTRDQYPVHPLSPAPTSPTSGTSTPRLPYSRSPEMRPQAVLFPADLNHNFDIASVPPSAVYQPLPPLPEPPSAIPDKIRNRVKLDKTLDNQRKPSKNNLAVAAAVAAVIKPTPQIQERQPISLNNPPRKCIHYGKILQVINVSTAKERYLFLFSDILLIAKHMSEGKPTLDSRFQVKDVIELKKISLSLSRDKEDSKSGEACAMGNRKIPPILAEFIHSFDQSPTRALNNFVQKRALHPDPISVAHLLFKTPELSKPQLATFLSNPANKYVYRAFLDQFQFAGMLLDEALRSLLSRLSLPDRVAAQRTGKPSERNINGVDYLLEEFTKRWYEANVNVVVFDASIAHKLVIAMIVLNAQLHNNDGESIVKGREEVGILVRPRMGSQPSTPTIPSTPVMESNLTVPPVFSSQQYMTMDLDDLTMFPTPTKESFVEMFQLLDQQRIVPKDTLNNVYMSISHQALDIDFEDMDAPRSSDSASATTRKLWPIMVSPAVLPPRLILKVPSDPITITLPALNPHFSIHLGGRDLKCEPSILEFGSHRSQRFRITGAVPGKKTLTIQPRMSRDKGSPEQYYDLSTLSSRHPVAIERQFMRHTFQVSLLNDLGTRRRYLFGASTASEKDEWARVLTDCLLEVKGQNAVRLNEHTGLEQSIGLQILKELLLGVETSEDDVVPSQSNGQTEAAPIPVVPTPTMGLGIPLDGHTLPVANPRISVVPSAVTLVTANGHSSPTLGVGANTEWATNTSNSNGGGGATSPKDTWMCKMPRPGMIVPDRLGWELIRLVEQNSLMALMLGFMGALGRDRLRRLEAARRTMEEEEDYYDEDDDEYGDDEYEAMMEEDEEEYYEEYDELDEVLEDEDEYEYEVEYMKQRMERPDSREIGDNEMEQRVPFFPRPVLHQKQQQQHPLQHEFRPIEINVEYVPDTTTNTGSTGSDADMDQSGGGSESRGGESETDRSRLGGEEVDTDYPRSSTENVEQEYDSEDGIVSAVSGKVRTVKGKEIWWTQ